MSVGTIYLCDLRPLWIQCVLCNCVCDYEIPCAPFFALCSCHSSYEGHEQCACVLGNLNQWAWAVHACMHKAVEKESASAALIRENVSMIFSRATVLISGAKQTGPCFWPTQRPLCEGPLATSIAANAEFKAAEMKGSKRAESGAECKRGPH